MVERTHRIGTRRAPPARMIVDKAAGSTSFERALARAGTEETEDSVVR